MASTHTEDYYYILGVDQTAHSVTIKAAWKVLALKLHPDHNKAPDAKEAFQALVQAYETLQDEGRRHTYDRDFYPSLKRGPNSSANSQGHARQKQSPHPQDNPKPEPTSKPNSEPLDEAAQIAALQRSARERSTRLATKRARLLPLIAACRKEVDDLKQRLKDLHEIEKAEAANEVERNEWKATATSRKEARKLSRKAEKLRKEEDEREGRGKQERMMEKILKERKLVVKEGELKRDQDDLTEAKELADAADKSDLKKIASLQASIMAKIDQRRRAKETEQRMAREAREARAAEQRWAREAEEAAQRESGRMAKLRRQWREDAKRGREEAEKRRKQKQQEAETRRLHEEEMRRQKEREDARLACYHDGRWYESQDYSPTLCPICWQMQHLLLQCPACDTLACTSCRLRFWGYPTRR